MAEYRIHCTTKDGPDPDYRLDGFGSTDANGKRYYDTLDQLLNSIDNGNTFYVLVNQRRVRVFDAVHPRTRRRYVTTEGDAYPPNNLLNLPDCR